jgi:hypothetical protein
MSRPIAKKERILFVKVTGGARFALQHFGVRSPLLKEHMPIFNLVKCEARNLSRIYCLILPQGPAKKKPASLGQRLGKPVDYLWLVRCVHLTA